MDEVPELNTYVLEAVLKVVRSIPELHDAEAECSNLTKCQEEVTDALVAWRSKQSDIHARNLDLQQQVALAERQLITAKMDDLDDCLEAIEEQLLSIKMQKETLEKPEGDEAFLKNELSLFLNVSSILPDLAEPKFSGTYVDKQKGVKTFKFSSKTMSQFEIGQAAWELMK
ncbi:hypothetical protein AXG93_1487s1030 [Marchantia polymorpha subsp. ruderalis]|uniref:Kinetochore protein Spc24 n=1 Tax=Marchantia polymorpha subsp. ruderalis TaxID=1480154 RepID=A0A176WN39_MARPO|nr:hypothetical protein AXG93_1487s1030 [Marchantia polymorpha subsp. ruderalis]